MVSDHINYLTFEDPGAVHTVRRALKLAEAGDLHGAAETAGVEVAHAAVVSQGLRRGMRFSIGAELDNDPRSRPDAQNIVDAMRPDGMIRSVHFLTIEHPEKGPDWQWPFDNPDFRELYDVVGTERVWELYMAKLLDDVEKLPGNIVGHFYVPAIFGHWPDQAKLEQYEDRLLDACFARGMAIEVNSRVFYRDHAPEIKDAFRAAYVRLMRKAKEKGVPIAIGADAHSPRDQGGAFDVVLEMLDEAEINEIVFPVAGRLARVALRATKEHLEKLKQQEPVTVQPGSSISGLGRAELGLPEREEAEEKVAGATKLGHDASPKKRAASPARTKRSTKRTSVEEMPEGPGPEVATPETIAEATPEPEAAAPAPAPKKAASKTKKAAEPKPKPKPEPVAAAVPAPEPVPVAKPAAKPAKAIKAVAKTAKAAVSAVTSKKAAATKAAKPASKTAAKSVKTTKTAAKKTAAKAPAKKAAPAAKKAAPKKATPAKKAPAKKAAAKKTPARKAAPAKRPAAKKTTKPAAKKATSKKSTAKKQTRRR